MKTHRIVSLFALLAVLQPLAAQLLFEKDIVSIDADLFDEQAEAVFYFSNVGDTTIEITRVSASCGCTVPALSKRTYAPGESGEIKAVFKFGQRLGRQVNTITVQTDMPAAGIHRLRMETFIPEWAVRKPALLRWAAAAEPVPQTFVIEDIHPQVQLGEVPAETSRFVISEVETSATRRVFSVTPKTTDSRATEPLMIPLVATPEKGDPQRRIIRVHFMVR
jgi:hypothetical protein